MLHFEPLRFRHLARLLRWRNHSPEAWRTTHEVKWLEHVWWWLTVTRRKPRTYWAVMDDKWFVGQAELSNISWFNGTAEIGLVIDPVSRGRGRGREAVILALWEGFSMGLMSIWGEVYHCNAARHFWETLIRDMGGYQTRLPNRRWWEGRLFDSTYFSIDKEVFNKWVNK